MKVANIDHRAHLVEGGLCFDIAQASDGRFPADPQAVFARWQEISGLGEMLHDMTRAATAAREHGTQPGWN